MKSHAIIEILPIHRRTPHGVRGLKYGDDVKNTITDTSHPSRGAWIEIRFAVRASSALLVAPLTGCVD